MNSGKHQDRAVANWTTKKKHPAVVDKRALRGFACMLLLCADIISCCTKMWNPTILGLISFTSRNGYLLCLYITTLSIFPSLISKRSKLYQDIYSRGWLYTNSRAHKYMCIHICVHTHDHICIYIYTWSHLYIYIHMCTYIIVYIYVNNCKYKYHIHRHGTELIGAI